MKFLKPNRKKILLSIVLTLFLAFVSTKYATIGYIKNSALPETSQPVYFRIGPVFWLPGYLIFGQEIYGRSLVVTFLLSLIYWYAISYLLSSLVIRRDDHN